MRAGGLREGWFPRETAGSRETDSDPRRGRVERNAAERVPRRAGARIRPFFAPRHGGRGRGAACRSGDDEIRLRDGAGRTGRVVGHSFPIPARLTTYLLAHYPPRTRLQEWLA